MSTSDPKFDEFLFELPDPKDMLELLAISFPKSLEFIEMNIVTVILLMDHLL